MIHKHKNGTYSISAYQQWIPAIFEDERAAKYGFRFPNSELSKIQKEKGIVTFKDLQELRKKL